MKIFIPSFNRPWTATTHKLLGDTPYTLVLRDEEQARLYRENPDFRKVGIEIVGSGSVNDAREYCRTELSDGEWCLQMDDNIRGFTMADLDFYRSVTDVGRKPTYQEFNHVLNVQVSFAQLIEWVLKESTDEAERRGANIVGFSPHANPYFRQKKWYDVGYIQNKMVLVRKTPLTWDQSNGHPAMEEYALCAAQHLEYGRVLINKFAHPVARHYEPGGLGPYEERLPAKIAACEDLLVRFPGFFRPGVTCRHKYGAKAEPKPGELLIKPRTLEQVCAWQASMRGKTVEEPQESRAYSPKENVSKVLIMILGAGATGKTTLSRALAGNDAQEHRVELSVTEKGVRKTVKAPYVLGSEIAIAGNLKNTSDAIGAVDALFQTIDHCWQQRDVVIMDGFRCTNRLVRWVEEHPLKPAALFVYIELSLNNNLARLLGRRAGNGKIEAKLPTKTFLNVLSFRERALGVWNYAQDHYKRQPVRYLEIPEGMGPEESAILVQAKLSMLQCEHPSKLAAPNGDDATVDTSCDRTHVHREDHLLDLTPAKNSGGMGIDLQYGMDFRKHEYRREVFLRFYNFHLKYASHPGCVYFVFPFLLNRYGWDEEQRLWFAFINGNTQNPVTSKIIFDEFPDFGSLNLARLDSWFNAKWHVLAFDTDRRHHKKEFIKAVTGYKKLCGKSQAPYFATFMGGDNPYDNFRSAWKEVRDKFHSFGRLSAFSYLEYLRVMRVGDLDCDQLFLDDMQGSKSHRNGLAIVLGRDDLDWHDSNPAFDGKYTPETLAWLKEEGARLLAEAKERMKDKPYFYDVSYFTLESALCTYKSWHRPNRRYPNVYADLFHDRLKKAESHWPRRDLGEFWDARREYLPEHLRLEDNPADVGVKPLKQNHYRLTGQPIMMWKDWPCFRNDYNDEVNAAQCGMTVSTI